MAKYPGSVTARATKAGMSTRDWAAKNKDAEGNVGRLARMAYMQGGVHGGGDSDNSTPGDKRNRGNPLYQIG